MNLTNLNNILCLGPNIFLASRFIPYIAEWAEGVKEPYIPSIMTLRSLVTTF